MTKILAIDPGTITGWAVGAPGTDPTFGARNFGSGKKNGEIISTFRHWLNAMCYREKPEILAFEAPYIARVAPSSGVPQNAATLRRLLAIVGTIEAVGFELRLRVYETPTQEFCKFFTGRGRWPGGRDEKKRKTIEACHQLGWLDVTEDEADALSLWSYAEFITEPQIASRRLAGAKRELPLHGTLTPQTMKAPGAQTPRPSDDGIQQQELSQCQPRIII
jgi:hypothetical protein